MFADKKTKAFTLSYDDGVVTDRRFAEIINKYGIKCTFNLNSSFIGSSNEWMYKDLLVTYLDKESAKKTYQGHEIAVHTCTHPHLEELSNQEIRGEISKDRIALHTMFEQPVSGMAYPYGTYNDAVIMVAADCGISYSRTVVSTHEFSPPKDFLEWHFTCHHLDNQLMELAERFCNLKTSELQIFSVWGHSYEFEGDNNWEILENLCRYISGHDDICFGTNFELYHALMGDYEI